MIDTILKTVKGLPFYQWLFLAAIPMLAGAAGAQYGGLEVPEDLNRGFLIGAVLCLLMSFLSNAHTKHLESERQERDARVRIARMDAGLITDVEDERTVIRKKPE